MAKVKDGQMMIMARRKEHGTFENKRDSQYHRYKPQNKNNHLHPFHRHNTAISEPKMNGQEAFEANCSDC